MRILLINLFTASLFCFSSLNAQQYSLTDLETQFLQNNAELIANKFNVTKADVEIVQEKLWQNPTLSISEVNLWKTYNVEEQPYLIGKYGKNQQISVELEQLIETAGKRRKRVAVKELEKEAAIIDYEEVLRELKKELRVAYYSLYRVEQEELELKNMVGLFSSLNEQFKRQADKQNIAKVDYFRIHSELLSLKNELLELEKEKLEYIKQLRTLTNNKELKINDIAFSSKPLERTITIPLNLIEIVKAQNIGLKRQSNEINKAKKQLVIEKANKVPDLALQVAYDRGGNIMRDFVGFGVSMDLPVFNKNKENVMLAKLTIEQEEINKSALETNLINEINQLEEQLNLIENSINEWPKELINEQKQLIENYKKHLFNKEVTLIEFIDFTQAFREVNQAYLQLHENYYLTLEELQYILGEDL